jgi:hypothetical protein
MNESILQNKCNYTIYTFSAHIIWYILVVTVVYQRSCKRKHALQFVTERVYGKVMFFVLASHINGLSFEFCYLGLSTNRYCSDYILS